MPPPAIGYCWVGAGRGGALGGALGAAGAGLDGPLEKNPPPPPPEPLLGLLPLELDLPPPLGIEIFFN